jgi:hypothetical protein
MSRKDGLMSREGKGSGSNSRAMDRMPTKARAISGAVAVAREASETHHLCKECRRRTAR